MQWPSAFKPVHTAVDRADGKVGKHADEQGRRLKAALVLWANWQIKAARPDAKKPAPSKTHVEIHFLQSQRGHNDERTVS